MENENHIIGFFSLIETEIVSSFVGAFLVTDNFGLPLEFKCSHSVKPTELQKIMYGNQLKPYIAIDLCGIPIYDTLKRKPDFIFTNELYLIDLRFSFDKPTIFIQKSEESLSVEVGKENYKQKIENANNIFTPITTQYHSEFKDNSFKNQTTIQSFFNKFDLLEPFERIKKAVEILGRNDAKFK